MTREREMKKNKSVIVYSQGNNWMLDDNGIVKQLPYYIQTKKQVREHVRDIQRLNDPDTTIRIRWS